MQVDCALLRPQNCRLFFFFFFLTFSRVKFHGSVYKLVKEGKRNKTCNCPFSEEKRPIIEAEINMALKIS